MENKNILFFLMSLINETLPEIDIIPDEVRAKELRRELEETLLVAATIPTSVGSHAWRAKVYITQKLFCAQMCDDHGNLPPNIDLLHTLTWSVLQDAASC